MNKKHLHIFFLLCLSALFQACLSKTEVETKGELYVPLQFSLSLQSSAATKSTVEVTQSDQVFRGIQDITIIPFSRQGVIESGDGILGRSDVMENITTLNPGNNSRLYELKWMPRGTASLLFYGSSRPYKGNKEEDGSLIAQGFTGTTAGDITFSPEPIQKNASETEKLQNLISWLNKIANTSYTYAGVTYYWRTYTWNSDIATLFSVFTNNGKLIAGSSESLRKMLSVIYLMAYSFNFTYEPERGLSYALMNNIVSNGVTIVDGRLVLPSDMDPYPGYGLPEGGAAVKWSGTHFVAGEDTGSLLARADHFCYPIKLWYYANSRINTTTNPDKTYTFLDDKVYKNSAYNTWAKVLSAYEHAPGIVQPETVGAALVNPVSYGVGLLELTLKKAQSFQLTDKAGRSVRVDNTLYPLTGIIVGEQRVQGFNFTPVGDEDYMIYDTHFSEDAYLSSTAPERVLQTLVLESVEDAVIHFALEFSNNSNFVFEGATGNILPGGKFYLLGNLDLKKLSVAQRTRNGVLVNKVFEQDFRTTVTVSVESLKDAYNTIPDLRDPQLQIGVVANIDWIMSTPTGIPLF